jgi:hypothetical protein
MLMMSPQRSHTRGHQTMTHRRFLLAVTFGAVSLAVGDRPANAQSSPSSSPVLTACAADIKALCPGLEPGGGRIRQCMKEKREQLSEGCRNAITAARAQRRGTGQSGSAD